jgi:ATP-dependent exoDNAse (exonuclease V) alpha subunit
MTRAEGRCISALQALAGTGKTRVLAALAQVYTAAGYHVFGVAPTGRAARELGDEAQIPASTIHRLVSDLTESGGFGARSIVLFDEAGPAPTRPSAALFAYAERSQTKVIAVGDSGQLPSVLAGGWFAGLTDSLGGPQLREVIRQRDIAERDALHALHGGEPDAYIELKQERAELDIHEQEIDAIEALLADWYQAQKQSGLAGAVMIIRDNDTRATLNDRARQLLIRDGRVAETGITVGDQQFCVGDRVVARRNDRHRRIENGTVGLVSSIDPRSSAVVVVTDSGEQRELDAEYVSEHLEHAYALTCRGAQGTTVEWAGVAGRPSEFTREWAYASRSRARARTRVYLTAEATANQRDREQYAPAEPRRSTMDSLEVMRQTMRRCESEPLAVRQVLRADVERQQHAHFEAFQAKTSEAGHHQTDWASERPSDQSTQRAHLDGWDRRGVSPLF